MLDDKTQMAIQAMNVAVQRAVKLYEWHLLYTAGDAASPWAAEDRLEKLGRQLWPERRDR